jgi:hypothetical protein
MARLSGATASQRRVFATAEQLRSDPVCAERPFLEWTDQTTGAVTVELLPASLRATHNSGYPVEMNDGLQWAGRGISSVLSAGLTGTVGRFRYSVAPVVAWHQNRAFAVYDTVMAHRKPFAYPWHASRIDRPQRFGDTSFFWVDAGESFVRADLGALAAAVSNEGVRWGPAHRYPLLLSTAAPGFPHFSLSPGRPWRLSGFAIIDLQILWGLLAESDHFDIDDENDRRLLSGVILAVHPEVLPGFSVGVASLVHTDLSAGFHASDLLSFAQSPSEGAGGNVDGNGIGALFARWTFPDVGFEAYAEWARDDYALDSADLLLEPDHAQAYTLGFVHVTHTGSKVLRFSGELTHLSNTERVPDERRNPVVFYTHATVQQGHTHRGQPLGAVVGPGSDAQHLAVDLLGSGTLWGAYAERIRWDDDAYVRYKSDGFGVDGHDVELRVGARHARAWNHWRADVDVTLGARRSRLFTNLVTEVPDLSWEPNVRIEGSLSWRIGR